jgi:hypothetical protein
MITWVFGETAFTMATASIPLVPGISISINITSGFNSSVSVFTVSALPKVASNSNCDVDCIRNEIPSLRLALSS